MPVVLGLKELSKKEIFCIASFFKRSSFVSIRMYILILLSKISNIRFFFFGKNKDRDI